MVLASEILRLVALVVVSVVGVRKFFLRRRFYRMKNDRSDAFRKAFASAAEPHVYPHINGLTNFDLFLLALSAVLAVAAQSISIVNQL